MFVLEYPVNRLTDGCDFDTVTNMLVRGLREKECAEVKKELVLPCFPLESGPTALG